MQNAETKSVAKSSGSRRLEMAGSGYMLVPMHGGKFGPERLIRTKGSSTTMAVSTLTHLMVSQKLRRGDGPDGIAMPDSRRSDRLFGDVGRTSYRSSGVLRWRSLIKRKIMILGMTRALKHLCA